MGKKFSRMKTNDIRVIKLMKEGFAFETLRNLNESQINILYKRMIKELLFNGADRSIRTKSG